VFGRGIFYQSFEDYGIEGQRPTSKRFEIYQLKKYLNSNMEVLDIGSNCGFFALYIAKYVRLVEGLEINKSLVNISKVSKVLFKINNAHFYQCDFKKYKFTKHYDFIFSFAVHFWIGMNIEKYAIKLWELLKENGYLLFESQNIDKQDSDWITKMDIFCKNGFEIIFEGSLQDDNKISRKFTLFKKINLKNR
jgi:protein-L-isoaspartate O-methyltransferase